LAVEITYAGEFPGVVVAVDGESLTFERGVPREVSDKVAARLLDESPTIWRAQGDKPEKAKKPAPDTKEQS
jgi:hypothetical protein